MSQRNTLWVVEMLNDGYRHRPARWESTVGVRLTKRDARKERREWKRRNPDNFFRIRCYYRSGK